MLLNNERALNDILVKFYSIIFHLIPLLQFPLCIVAK
jgi:hypothetical protein